jgi:hypothetical protein
MTQYTVGDFGTFVKGTRIWLTMMSKAVYSGCIQRYNPAGGGRLTLTSLRIYQKSDTEFPPSDSGYSIYEAHEARTFWVSKIDRIDTVDPVEDLVPKTLSAQDRSDGLRQGTRVEFNLNVSGLTGIGKIVGIANDPQPFIGYTYIIEPEIPITSAVYPYTHIVANSTMIQVLEEE